MRVETRKVIHNACSQLESKFVAGIFYLTYQVPTLKKRHGFGREIVEQTIQKQVYFQSMTRHWYLLVILKRL
ncbi:hypothetical protein CSV71_13715 [Sporosarcina sp. P21c]|nr:hypothetical protein CSV78_14190 [Sporosarcina sp. P16a]PIC88639.1 hypothetical protein CSV71_13715 [Sporosarcina sp. P21c]PIC91710.1 hypothetical protein CSV70_14170 [Sporosarcina sp. P25]